MNSVLSVFAAPLIAIQIFIVGTNTEEPCNKPDLTVLEIWAPEYVSLVKGAVFEVVIKNIGGKTSSPCTVKAFDLDIDYEEAIKTIDDTIILDLIAENNSRAAYNSKWDEGNENLNETDYDLYWEITETIPALKPGEEIRVTITVKDHWVYDANCEIRVIVDPEKTSKDCNRDNNQLDFFGWG